MLKNYWQRWKGFAERAGNVQANIFFSILYYLIVTPAGLIVGVLKDPLTKNKFPNWSKPEGEYQSLEDLKSL